LRRRLGVVVLALASVGAGGAGLAAGASAAMAQGPKDGPTDVLSSHCHFEGQAGMDHGQRAWCHNGKWVPVGSMSARPPRA
jgi:hypothetical protein